MKLFHIVATLQAPSDWSVDSMRQHLRKAMTKSEVERASIILLTEDKSESVVRSQPEVKNESPKGQ